MAPLSRSGPATRPYYGNLQGSMVTRLSMFQVLVLFLVVLDSQAYLPEHQAMTRRTFAPAHGMSPDDRAEHASPLPLTAEDLKRLSQMKSRHCTMPIMILDAMLPRQKLSFQSDDPKFRRLIDYCLEEDQPLGMLGLNPHTGRPLCRGVVLDVTDDAVEFDDDRDSITMSVQATKRMEVQGEPWLDETGSFYLAEIEILEDRQEPLTSEQQKEVKRLSGTLPAKFDEWVGVVLKSAAVDTSSMNARLTALGPMPSDPTNRALWVAAAINPLPPLGVCLEIRPAMLSCSNDLDRMILACQAVQSSIDHLSGKRRLF